MNEQTNQAYDETAVLRELEQIQLDAKRNFLANAAQQFESEVFAFNFFAGKMAAAESEEQLKQDVRNALNRISEELTETFDAVDEGNWTKVLDGTVDQLVVVYGLLHKLNQNGFLTLEAQLQTSGNNLTKMTITREVAEASVEEYAKQGIECSIVDASMPEQSIFVIKRKSDDKVMKPIGYVANELSKFVPEALGGNRDSETATGI